MTEVHHITGNWTDSEVVYCNKKGIENSVETKMDLAKAIALYSE